MHMAKNVKDAGCMMKIQKMDYAQDVEKCQNKTNKNKKQYYLAIT